MGDHAHQLALLAKMHHARVHDHEEEFLSHFDDDAEITTPKGSWKGKAEIRKWWQEKSDLPDWEDHWEHVEGHHFRRKGTAKKLIVTINLVQEVWIHNGKISKVHAHTA
eukprot:TRINITY_DN199_c0_g2_i1.p1 TRINITY_DN199_c0_g2~~TRINITY_DN199_c0_g2_i1.p1  ORF type:complete len:122 (+),score=38.75 TRINITY_DN199_c0_g2_i1:40-366(+)